VDRPYVEWVRIEGFRCIKRADVHLTPLHALIGPNDSGKSSILRAIVSHAADLTANTQLPVGPFDDAEDVAHAEASRFLARALLRFDPDELRAPMQLIPQGRPLWFHNEKGAGLAALCDALLSRDLSRFATLNEAFRALFPTVRSLRLHNLSPSEKQLGLTLLDGTEVGPAEMSEGMLYWLAFAIIEHLAPQAMILIEEPENGLHPARIREVMKVLREVSQRTQIILATHSPLVINELKPDEVTIVTRTPERGTICTPMTATKNFAQRSKIYALGELWLSYADGNFESELVSDGAEGIDKAG
jgi:predicted ATPase